MFFFLKFSTELHQIAIVNEDPHLNNLGYMYQLIKIYHFAQVIFPGSTYCFAGCTVEVNSSTTYDLSSLNGVTVFDQPSSFPDLKGNTFHYQYQLRVCSTRPDTDPPVIKVYILHESVLVYSKVQLLNTLHSIKKHLSIRIYSVCCLFILNTSNAIER